MEVVGTKSVLGAKRVNCSITNLLTYIFISLGTLLLFLLLEYLLNLVFFGIADFGTALLKVILPKLFFSGLLAYPVFYVLRKMSEKLWPGGDGVN